MKIAVTAAGATMESPVDPRFGRCPYFLLIDTEDLSFEAVANPHASRDSGAGIQAAQLVAEKGARFVATGNCGPNAYQTLAAAGVGVITGCSGTVRDVVEGFKAGRYSAAQQPNVTSHFGAGATSDGPAGPPVGPQAPASFAPGVAMGGAGFGRGMGQGGGAGMGMGRGMGHGMGRGMGRGAGVGRGSGQGAGMGRGGMGRGMGRVGGPGMGWGETTPNAPPGFQPQPVPQPQPGSEEELAALKAQARAAEEQLAALNERIGHFGQEATTARLVAVVDADRCTGCRLCAQVCPAGAIAVNAVATIEVSRCTACGQCVAECPQDAIALRKAR